MDSKEYQEFREERKQKGRDGLDFSWELMVCAEYLIDLAGSIDGTDDINKLISASERAKEALHWAEATCTFMNAIYVMFQDVDKRVEASTDNSYVTITFELNDDGGEHEGSE